MDNDTSTSSGTNRPRTDQAKAELSRDSHSMSWKLADVKAATRKRSRARLAKPGTVFTSDPQSLAPVYVPKN